MNARVNFIKTLPLLILALAPVYPFYAGRWKDQSHAIWSCPVSMTYNVESDTLVTSSHESPGTTSSPDASPSVLDSVSLERLSDTEYRLDAAAGALIGNVSLAPALGGAEAMAGAENERLQRLGQGYRQLSSPEQLNQPEEAGTIERPASVYKFRYRLHPPWNPAKRGIIYCAEVDGLGVVVDFQYLESRSKECEELMKRLEPLFLFNFQSSPEDIDARLAKQDSFTIEVWKSSGNYAGNDHLCFSLNFKSPTHML